MKALLSTEVGGPETLRVQTIDAPTPGEGEVRIGVRACGINFPDVLITQDLYQFKPPRPFAPGAEISGVVDALGPGVTTLAVGQRVAAMIGWGGLVEQVVVAAEKCFPIPDALSDEAAAAFLMTYGTSWHALKDRAALQAGETLLVLGAAGGVGLAAVELGKAVGARVVAGVSSEAKAQVARAHGADEVLIYPSGAIDADAGKALTREIRRLAGGEGVDVIYDAIGGGYAEPSFRAMAWKGRYLVVGFPAGIPRLPTNLALLKGASIIGVFLGQFIEREREHYRACVAELLAFHAAGKITPLVSEVFPLERGGEAIARLSSRQAVGKIVVRVA